LEQEDDLNLNLRRNLKQLFSLGVGLFFIALLIYGSPKFRTDFTGMNEADVCRKLGEPLGIREADPEREQKRTLVWQVSFESRLYLYFEDGRVVSQIRYSR
jgi:hypothetical protein